MEHKNLPLEVKNLGENGTFEGYASAFGNVDSWKDVIEAGAFSATIREHSKRKTMPALLWCHDVREPIGVWESMKEDATGLFAQGRLLKDDVQKAAEAYALLKAGAVRGLSIGYRARDYSIDEKTGVRALKRVDLFEVSLVTFPANEKALVSGVKDITTIRDFEGALRDVLGFSNTEAKRIASCGFRELKARDVPVNDESEQVKTVLLEIANHYL